MEAKPNGQNVKRAAREARHLARTAERLAEEAANGGHMQEASRWLAVAVFLRDLADSPEVIVATQQRLWNAKNGGRSR